MVIGFVERRADRFVELRSRSLRQRLDAVASRTLDRVLMLKTKHATRPSYKRPHQPPPRLAFISCKKSKRNSVRIRDAARRHGNFSTGPIGEHCRASNASRIVFDFGGSSGKDQSGNACPGCLNYRYSGVGVRASRKRTTGAANRCHRYFHLSALTLTRGSSVLTNFHLLKSTLLMLVSAAGAGREFVLRAYAEAIRECYRFYSYGDCMLIL